MELVGIESSDRGTGPILVVQGMPEKLDSTQGYISLDVSLPELEDRVLYYDPDSNYPIVIGFYYLSDDKGHFGPRSLRPVPMRDGPVELVCFCPLCRRRGLGDIATMLNIFTSERVLVVNIRDEVSGVIKVGAVVSVPWLQEGIKKLGLGRKWRLFSYGDLPNGSAALYILK